MPRSLLVVLVDLEFSCTHVVIHAENFVERNWRRDKNNGIVALYLSNQEQLREPFSLA